jgi:hypothetical protein
VSIHYGVRCEIRPKPGVPGEVLSQLESLLEENLGYGSVCYDAQSDTVQISGHGETGYGPAKDVNEALDEFAKKWAAQGAVVETICDRESGELLVGPDEKAKLLAKAAHLAEQVADLATRLQLVHAQLREGGAS